MVASFFKKRRAYSESIKKQDASTTAMYDVVYDLN